MMETDALYTLYLQHPEICTDTRKIKLGCLFFALQGSNFDGNAFAPEALRLGAALAVVSDPSLEGPEYFYVPDTLVALQSLARFHRTQLNIPLISITGSNGKTTTKELITCALKEKYKVHSTAGNLNNHIGVPLTLLSASLDTEIIVCEMGANHMGEIEALCKIAMPTHGIITNIGNAHLEGFGSIEGVQKAKGELFEYLNIHGGHAFVNIDDARLKKTGENILYNTTYGFDLSSSPDIAFEYIASVEHDGFTIQDTDHEVIIHSQMFGFYNASNVLAAYTIAKHFNVPIEKIAVSLSSFIPGANRSETISHRGCRIIKDAYNANPSSMELALRAFAQQYPDGWILLGDMKELGQESDAAHRRILNVISELGFQNAVLVGNAFKSAMHNEQNLFPDFIIAESIDDVRSEWNWEKCKGKTLLLKGSRSMQMEKILED
ncbi:MAG TPA: UDP-N-acetylmuramoyl-tripeptide--D-alanyl-D-alanine ligase [Saprospiraceae bacterium]|nr:UDP-N-acetylmuramoyl-tripeptide--D-alanyl-D-alanine ligase [Saprospiraceae bacterium]